MLEIRPSKESSLRPKLGLLPPRFMTVAYACGTRITCLVLAEVFGGRSRRDEIRPQTCACASMLGRFCAGSHVFERDATMAKRLSFYCDLCDKSYDFRSRYDRHLLSSTHRDLEGAIKLLFQRLKVTHVSCQVPLLNQDQ